MSLTFWKLVDICESGYPLEDESKQAAGELRRLQSENQILRKVSDEYNAWIKHHAAGHSYDDFLSKRIAHGIKENT